MKKLIFRHIITVIFLCIVFAGCSLKKSSISDSTKIKIDELLKPYEMSGAPGYSMAVVRNGKIVYERSNGFSEVETKRMANKYTNYRLASVTKQFTALGILQLNEAKRLSVEDPIQKYLPGLHDYAQDIRIKHLLNHTSGLVDYEDLIEGTTAVLDKDVLKLLEKQDTVRFAAGTKYEYSNTGYSLLALIIEKVSGETYPEYISAHIFKPLKMDSSSFNVVGVHIPNRAYGYSKRDTGYERTDQSNSSFVLGDGGIYSSVSDMVKWENSLSTSKLIANGVLQQAKTHGYDLDSTNGYGCGWRIERRHGVECFHHSGGTRGFQTHHIYIPEKKTGVIFLINRTGSGLDPADLSDKICELFITP